MKGFLSGVLYNRVRILVLTFSFLFSQTLFASLTITVAAFPVRLLSLLYSDRLLVTRGVTGNFFWGGKVIFPDFFPGVKYFFPDWKFLFW